MRSFLFSFVLLVMALPAAAQEATRPAGIVGIQLDVESDFRSVAGTAPDSPAAKAGIQAGDYVLAVDGISTKNFQLEELVAAISGKPGTQVVLTLQRGGGDKREHLILTRVPVEDLVVSGK